MSLSPSDSIYNSNSTSEFLQVYAFERLKNLWRAEAIETPTYCSEDAPVAECGWVCADDITTSSMAQSLMELVTINAGVVSWKVCVAACFEK
jgi:hypothetical protein